MIPSKNFFNVCATAIRKCRWLGEDAPRIHLALKELDRLEKFATEQRAKIMPTNEFKPEAGDIEYHDPEKPEEVLEVEDEDIGEDEDFDDEIS